MNEYIIQPKSVAWLYNTLLKVTTMTTDTSYRFCCFRLKCDYYGRSMICLGC